MLRIAFALMLLASPAMAARELSLAEAKHLVETYLASDGSTALKLPGFSYDFAGRLKAHARFYRFDAIWNNTGEGSVVVGFYFVDGKTADVWDEIACEAPAATPALEKMQARLRHKIGLSQARYARLRYSGDVCGID